MKNLILLPLLISSLWLVGCAKEKTATTSSPEVTPPTVNPVNPTVPTGTGTLSQYGTTVSLELTGASTAEQINTLNDFLGNTRPVNDPSSLSLHVDFEEVDGGTYMGQVSVSFSDNGRHHVDTFRSGVRISQTRYNKWILNNNGFHAILDDGNFGALVFVIDDVVNLGDGNGAENLVNGTIFYMNYPIVVGPFGERAELHPQRIGGDGVCWDVRIGVYQCMPWNSQAHADSTIYPPRLFKVLGKFKGLDVSKAFNL